MFTELRSRVFTPVRALATMLLSVAGVVAAVLVLIGGALVLVGIGRYVVPPAVWLLRKVADAGRGLVRMAGVGVVRPYGPETGAIALLKSRSTWRDVLWAFIDPVIGTWATATAIAMPLFGVYGAVVQPFVWRANERAGGINSFGPIHVTSTATAIAAIPVGLAMIAAGLYVGPPLLTLRAGWSADLLGPSRTAALEERVETLVETRADSAGAQAAELRRIERDLHDGAQARLVALGMSLSNAERLFDEDPAAARNLVIAAREASSRALDELRDLVRGVHPPVLADRGLADAIRALALDSLVEVDVTSDLPGRPSLPVESAVYFAVNELLTNATKHARTATTVTVSLHHANGVLRCEVTDDGPGGADPMNGTGLRGIESRLAIFDGTVEVDSPTGGPTRVQLEVPCAIRSV